MCLYINYSKKVDLADLKPNVDKLNINELKTFPDHLKNLKSKVNKMNVKKLRTFPSNLKKLSDIVGSEVVNKTVYDRFVLKVNSKIPSTSGFINNHDIILINKIQKKY